MTFNKNNKISLIQIIGSTSFLMLATRVKAFRGNTNDGAPSDAMTEIQTFMKEKEVVASM